MARHAYPEFHKALLDQSLYPAAPRKIKFEETALSYLYRTGAHVYKIRKPSSVYASTAIKERYAQLALTLGRHWAPAVVEAVVPIVRTNTGFALGGPGEVVDYALRMVQLPDNYWLRRLLDAGKVTPTLMGRLARFLAERHGEAVQPERAAEGARPDELGERLVELAYQSRKYEEVTVSQPALDMIVRPMERYLEETRRTISRRPKRGRIVDGHGDFRPQHIHVRGTDICAVAPLEAQPRIRIADAAHDVATLVNCLALGEHSELAEVFVKRYATAAKDRDLGRVLPIHRVLHALRTGLACSERLGDLAPEHPDHGCRLAEARGWYNLALRVARELPRNAAPAAGSDD